MSMFSNKYNQNYGQANKIDEEIIYHDSLKKQYLSSLFEQQQFENNLLQMYIKLMKLLQTLNNEKIASERQLSSSLKQLLMLQQQKKIFQSRIKQIKNEFASLQENSYILKSIEINILENEMCALKNMERLKKEISQEKEMSLLLQNQLRNYKLKVLDIEEQKLTITKIIESRLQKYKMRKMQLSSSQGKHQHILIELNSIQQQYEQLNKSVAFKVSENQFLTQQIFVMKNQHKTIAQAINHKNGLLFEEQLIIKQFCSHQTGLAQEIQINKIQLKHQCQDTKLLSDKIARQTQQKQFNQYTIEKLQLHLKNILQANKQIQQFLLDCYQQDDALIQLIQKRRALNWMVSRKINQSYHHQLLTEHSDNQAIRINQIGNINNKSYFPQNKIWAMKNRFSNQSKKLTLDKQNVDYFQRI